MNLLNLLRKSDKMLIKHPILSLFPNLFNKFNKTQASIYLIALDWEQGHVAQSVTCLATDASLTADLRGLRV